MEKEDLKKEIDNLKTKLIVFDLNYRDEIRCTELSYSLSRAIQSLDDLYSDLHN